MGLLFSIAVVLRSTELGNSALLMVRLVRAVVVRIALS